MNKNIRNDPKIWLDFEKEHISSKSIDMQRLWICSRLHLATEVETTSQKPFPTPLLAKVKKLLNAARAIVMCTVHNKMSDNQWFNTPPKRIFFHNSSILIKHGDGSIPRYLNETDANDPESFHIFNLHPLHTSYEMLRPFAKRSLLVRRSILKFFTVYLSPLPEKYQLLAKTFHHYLIERKLRAPSLEKINSIFKYQLASLAAFDNYLKQLRADFPFLNTAKEHLISVYYSSAQQSWISSFSNEDVEISEIQHGYIGENHPGYNLSEHLFQKKLFPQKIYLWGKGWLSLFNLSTTPFEWRTKLVCGHPNHSKPLNIANTGTTNILITSQGILNETFHRFLNEFIKSRKPSEVVYLRLHPADSDKRAAYFKNLAKRKNVILVDSQESVFESFSKSIHAHISVFSTSLYEANMLGIQNFIPRQVNLSELSFPLIKSGGAQWIEANHVFDFSKKQQILDFFEPYRRFCIEKIK